MAGAVGGAVRRRSRRLASLATAVLLVSACGSGAAASDPVAPPGSSLSASPAAGVRAAGPGPVTIRVPADAPTISAGLSVAHPGDLVLVSPGTYRETVALRTDGVTLRGTDRNTVVVDGEVLRPNGIVVTGSGDTVENLTVRNATLNGVLVTGMSDASGGLAKGSDGYTRLDPAQFPPIAGFAVRSVTSYDNGLYGIYAFDARDGVIEGTYTSGSADSGLYVGQCQPCRTTVRGNVAERNAVGYEGTNASGQMVVVGNRFSSNRVGMTTDSDHQEALVPQHDAVIVGNLVSDNAELATPAQADGGWGVGIGIAGGRSNLIERNRVTGNPTAGVVIASAQDLAPVGNQLRGNLETSNGVDVAYTASATAPGSGNCVASTGRLTTVPSSFAVTARCPAAGVTTGRPAAGAALRQPAAPPGVPFTDVAAPPAQPSMASPATARFGPVTGGPVPDVAAVPVPPADLLADRLLGAR